MKESGRAMQLADVGSLVIPMEIHMKGSGSKIMPTAMGCFRTAIMRSMRESGRWISSTAEEKRLGEMEVHMMVNTLMV